MRRLTIDPKMSPRDVAAFLLAKANETRTEVVARVQGADMCASREDTLSSVLKAWKVLVQENQQPFRPIEQPTPPAAGKRSR